MKIDIKRVDFAKILHLRHAVLRPGLPFHTAYYRRDCYPWSRHFAAFCEDGTGPISCVSFHLSHWQLRLPSVWYLCGVATTEKYRGNGIGKRVIAFAEGVMMEESGIQRFWCKARLSSIPFYKEQGWVLTSGEFDMEVGGHHREMVKNLPMSWYRPVQ